MKKVVAELSRTKQPTTDLRGGEHHLPHSDWLCSILDYLEPRAAEVLTGTSEILKATCFGASTHSPGNVPDRSAVRIEVERRGCDEQLNPKQTDVPGRLPGDFSSVTLSLRWRVPSRIVRVAGKPDTPVARFQRG